MIHLTRRRFGAGALSLTAAAVPRHARAETWPDRVVTMVVPYPAGGVTDLMARIMADRLTLKFGQRFIIDNRGGAGGATAATFVSRAEPNGYTFLFASSPQLTIAPFVQKVTYDPINDFTPIVVLGTVPHPLAIKASLPPRTLAEFIAYAKERPGQLNYATAGYGTIGHLCSEVLAKRAGIELVHVPYKSGPQLFGDFLGGQVEVYFGSADLFQFANNPSIRIIGVSTLERVPQLPKVPAISETLPGFDLVSWQGLVGPRGTPRAIVDKIAAEIAIAVTEPQVAERMTAVGITPSGLGPADFVKLIGVESGLFKDAVDSAGIGVK